MADFVTRANEYEFSKAVSRPWRSAFSIHARSFWRWVKTRAAIIEIPGSRADNKESLRRWLSVSELLLMCRSESKRTRKPLAGLALLPLPTILPKLLQSEIHRRVAPNYHLFLPCQLLGDLILRLGLRCMEEALPGVPNSDKLLEHWLER